MRPDLQERREAAFVLRRVNDAQDGNNSSPQMSLPKELKICVPPKELKMSEILSPGRSWLRATGIGLGVAVLTAIVMVILAKIGVSPFPKPPSLAFAETLLGRELPLPAGLLFHTAYVIFWCVVFVRFFPQRNLKTALGLALALWLVILMVFFPLVGWGFAGLHISPKLIPASLLPHFLFGILLWGLNKYLPRKPGSTA